MSKSHAHLITEDHDGTFFCEKCGKAGFKTQSSAYGHLSQCKGYEAVLKKAKETYKQRNARIEMLASDAIKDDLNCLESESNEVLVASQVEALVEPETTHEATLRPASPLPLRPANLDKDTSEVASLRMIIAMKEKENKELRKMAFNHNAHFRQPTRQVFNGPNDIIAQGYNDIFQNKWLRYLAGITAFIVFLNFAKKQWGELRGPVKKTNGVRLK